MLNVQQRESESKKVSSLVQGVPTNDGAGVKLTRIIGSGQLKMLDPFLLLDCFESDNPDDYIAGFPPHPHRGFETVTYIIDGQMRHADSRGNEGVIKSGGVQWMTVGRGILHSEMPEQQDGLLKGFQLWINLPKSHKMCEPKYQEFSAQNLPMDDSSDDYHATVISGVTDNAVKGPVVNPLSNPLYLDVSLRANGQFQQSITPGHNSCIYLIEGNIEVAGLRVKPSQLAVLGQGESVAIKATEQSRFLLIAAKPMNETVVRYGPFVMNDHDELKQAFLDFENGDFGKL